jgi:hypothetical protein
MSLSKQEALLLEERIEKIRKKNEEIKRRHLVRFSFLPTDVKMDHSDPRMQDVGQGRIRCITIRMYLEKQYGYGTFPKNRIHES